jgi:polyhydroxyalkanoate synthesis regulator phasin
LQDYRERNPLVEQLSERIKELEEKVGELQDEVQKWQRIRKPTHGPCCTCQRCGQFYDDCRCDLDETVDLLQQAESRIKVLMEEGGQDCRQHNLMVEQLSERIKELETDLKFRDSYEKQPPK